MLINYKLDTETDGNMLPLHNLCKVKPDMDIDLLAHTINPIVKLEAYTRNEIKQYVFVKKYKDYRKLCRFYMVDRPVALLGLQGSIALNLITVNVDSVQEFPTGMKVQIKAQII